METTLPSIEEIMHERSCTERYARKVRALLKAGKPAPRMVPGYEPYGDPEETLEAVEGYLALDLTAPQAAAKITAEGVSLRTFFRRLAVYVAERDSGSMETF